MFGRRLISIGKKEPYLGVTRSPLVTKSLMNLINIQQNEKIRYLLLTTQNVQTGIHTHEWWSQRAEVQYVTFADRIPNDKIKTNDKFVSDKKNHFILSIFRFFVTFCVSFGFLRIIQILGSPAFGSELVDHFTLRDRFILRQRGCSPKVYDVLSSSWIFCRFWFLGNFRQFDICEKFCAKFFQSYEKSN